MPTLKGRAYDPVVAREKRPKPLHERLHALLCKHYAAGDFDQTSLAEAIGNTQTTAGLYLRGKKSGPLDLDEADAALRHINSSLIEFLRGQPPAPMTEGEKVGKRVSVRDDLWAVVAALLDVPRTRLPVVIGQIDAGVYAATGRRLLPSDESDSEKNQAMRTTKGPKTRR